MAKKLLIGVQHADFKEIDVLLSFLSWRSYDSVGLELCQDYQEKKRLGNDGYFYQLARRLEGVGKKIIPLDDRALFQDGLPLGYLVRAYADNNSVEKLRWEIFESYKMQEYSTKGVRPKDHSGVFSHPFYSLVLEKMKVCENYAQALSQFYAVDRKREDFMLGNIFETNPDVVILGGAHIPPLQAYLAEYSSSYLHGNFVLPNVVYHFGKKMGVIKHVSAILPESQT